MRYRWCSVEIDVSTLTGGYRTGADGKTGKVVPLTLQMVGVLLLKVMARPESVVADAVVVPPTFSVVGLKLMVPMVWLILVPVVLLVICGAGS